jgi:anti-sigma B factor antagonist
MTFGAMAIQDGDVATIHLHGEADLAVVDQLFETMAEARAVPGVRRIVMDLARLTFVDSSGLGALIAGYRMATQDGLAFTVVDPTPAVRSLLGMTGVLQLLTGEPEHEDVAPW